MRQKKSLLSKEEHIFGDSPLSREIPKRSSERYQSRGSVRRVVVGIGILVMAGIALGGMFSGIHRAPPSPENTSLGDVPEGTIVSEEVPTEEESVSDKEEESASRVFSSENYRIGQIILGGDIGVLASSGDRFVPLAIEDIRGETLGSGNNEGRVLLTWKTSKSALSTLRYSKTAGGSEKVIEEDGYGLSHSIVLSGLDLATTYLYVVEARDRSGNVVKSDAHAVYTGSKTISLFELITGALQDVFGWAVKK